MKYIVIAFLALFFVYMVVWTLKLYFHTKRQNKVKRIQELRAKGREEKQQPVDDTKDYWYNKREVELCKEDEDVTKYYNFFDSVEDGFHGLLLEMYDCGIVRTDELEQLSYGKNRFQNMDLSFLADLEKEILGTEDTGVKDTAAQETTTESVAEKTVTGKTAANKETDTPEDIIQVEGMTEGFFAKSKPDIVTAAKELKSDDPGITDIHGTLSDGVVNVIAAVETEKKEEAKKNEPILIREEKSVEEARKARKMTNNTEVRNKVYSKWTGYVEELLEMVVIHSSDETRQKLRKTLMEYGHNDVDVLLESPEY